MHAARNGRTGLTSDAFGENASPEGVPRCDDHRSDGRSCTPHEVEYHRDYGKNQQNVDEEGCDMKDEKSAQPQKKQDNSQR